MRAMNRFKKFIDKQSYSNAQILATKIWNINFSAEFTPYTHIIIFNHNATVTLEVTPNGAGIGDDTVQAGGYSPQYVLPGSALVIEVEDNILMNRLALRNTHAADALAAADITVLAMNY